MKTMTRLALLAALVGFAVPALAASTTSTFQVTATVIRTCQIQNTNTLAFGNYDTMSTTDQAATANFTFRCNKNTPYQIAIDNGLHLGAAAAFGASRSMQGATVTTDFLAYGLFRDLAHTLPWGQTLGTDSLDGIATSATPIVQPIYGLIPQAQDVTAQAYSDATVTISVNY